MTTKIINMTAYHLLMAWLSLHFSGFTFCFLLLKLNHAVALQEQSPRENTQSAGKSLLYQELRKHFNLVYLSFPLHLGTEATGSHLKEIKSVWRLYKFSASSDLCKYDLSILFFLFLPVCTFVSSPGNLEHVLLCAWLVWLISAVLLYLLSLLGSLQRMFLWGSRGERVLILHWVGDRTIAITHGTQDV